MKVQLLLPLTILISVVLVGIMKIRKKEHEKVDRRGRFEDIRLRVTHDVLEEYQSEKAERQDLLDKTNTDVKALAEEVNMLQMKDTTKKAEVDICQTGQKASRDELALAETELNNLQAESSKEKASWSTELATLKQQLETRSPVCDFLKPGQDADKKLCAEVIAEAPKPEEPKAEAPKPEDPKAEAPKPEEPKAEAPKPEEPKAEAPKPEEPKAEAPKPEDPKAEAPKPEDPKAEAPKPEEPKAEAPKPEEPKAEAPKPEEPKAEAPKPEEPKAEAPKPEEPKAEAPKPEEPKAEAPKPEEPKAEAPKPEEPKADVPKAEAPKAEAPKAEAPKAEALKKR